jgi:RHS repeat-associated protein
MATDTDIETDTESSPPDRAEQPKQTNSTSTTETESSYQFRDDQIRELDEYEENEEDDDPGIGPSDTATREEYAGSSGYGNAPYQFRDDQIRELDEYEENEEDDNPGIGSGDTTTREEYAGSSGYIDTEIDRDIENQPVPQYRHNPADQDDHIGDTDPIINSEQAPDDSCDDRADGSQAAHTTHPADETEQELEENTEPHPDPSDLLEPLVDEQWSPDDEPTSHSDKLNDANRIVNEKQPNDKQPLGNSLDETEDGVDTRPIPESPIGDDSATEPGVDTYRDAHNTKPPAATETSSSHSDESGDTGHLLDDERPADNSDVGIGLDSQHISPDATDETNSDAVYDAAWEANTVGSGVTQAGSYPYDGDLLEKSDVTDTDLDGFLPQGHRIDSVLSGERGIGVTQLAPGLPEAPPRYEPAAQVKPVSQQPVEPTDTPRSLAGGIPSLDNDDPGSGDGISDDNSPSGDLSHNADDEDTALQQGLYPHGATEGMPDSNKKPISVPHNDAHAKSHVSSSEIADDPVNPFIDLASDTGEQAHLLAVANQALPTPATNTNNQTLTQEPVGQPPGSTVDIYKPPSAEPDNTPHFSRSEDNGAQQSEPAADSTVKNALVDGAAAFSPSESDLSDGDSPIAVSAEIDNFIETDSDTRNDTQDVIEEQSVAQSDPELMLPGQSVQFDSVQVAQDNYPPDEGATDTIPLQDDSTEVADASEELAEPATETSLGQICASGDMLAEDDENSTEGHEDVIRSSTDATADESDPDSQLNNDLERPKNPRATASQVDDHHVCGDPIDVASGEVILHQTDVELAGALPLILTRTHVSSYRAGRWFGHRWASSLDQRLKIDEHGACYAAADGMILVYPPLAGGMSVLPEEGPRWPLTYTAEGTYTITNPQRGHTLHFTPLTSGNPVLPLGAITDRNGHRIDFDYTPGGAPTQIRHSGGYRITIDTSNHRITALHLHDLATHTAHTLIRYTYDSHNHLTGIINSSDLPLRLDYDTQGRLTSWQDRNHTSYHYTYNQAGRCIRAAGSDGFLNATLAYDLDNQTTTVTNSLGQVTTFHLNKLGQVIGETDPLGHVTTSEWDRYDRLLTRTDPLKRTTRYTYDPTGNLIAVTRPDGSHTSATYNNLQLPTSIIDYDGTTWLRDYDQQGNLTTLTNPLGATTHYTHNKHGHLATITDALGNTHHIDTNPAGLPTMIISPRGGSTRYEYDAFGRVKTITDPIGGITCLGWTVEGKLAWRIQPDGASERFTYDGEGNLTEHLNPAGGLTRTQYTHFDLPAAQIGPDGARLEFGYDTELRLTSVTNSQGLMWRYAYDPAGNFICETDFNDRTLTYTHDVAGQLTTRTNGIGQTTRYTRDLLGNIIKQHSTDTIATFAYDPLGRIVAATNTDAEITFQRDPLGQIVAETCNGRTLTSTYNSLGHRTHCRTPTGAESTWEYDTDSQPSALHTAGRTLRFSYDAAGRETQCQLGAGVMLAQTWDTNHRLLSQTLTTNRTNSQQPQSARHTRLIQRRSYTYRPDGYPTTINDHLTGTRRFDLDPTGRITTVHGSGWTERYAYDPAGNITHATWPTPPQTDPPDTDTQGEREYAGTLIRRAGNIRYQHDAQGRVIRRQQKRLSAKPRTWHYTWNTNDQLTTITTPDGIHWRYLYDPLGRRIAKQCLADDNTTVVEQVDFTWDGPVLAEQTHTHWPPRNSEPAGSRTTTWNWQPNTFRPISQTERTPLHDTPQDVCDAPQEWIDQKFYAIITDLIGTPTELVEPDGTIAWRPHSTLWGTLLSQTANNVYTLLRFPGQYHDPETSLNYNYHRYYDPITARYNSTDPLGLSPAPNPHAYVTNPIREFDTFGLAPYRLARFGLAAETAESLSKQAAEAEATGNFPHGVSTFSESTRKDAAWADASEIKRHFSIEKTGGNPYHYTIVLPKPVTQKVADTFNSLFGRTSTRRDRIKP